MTDLQSLLTPGMANRCYPSIRVPHPIPYQGSKRNIASEILRYFPEKIRVLQEPFAGSAAISLAAAARGLGQKYWLNDLNKPLMDLWGMIINQPGPIARE